MNRKESSDNSVGLVQTQHMTFAHPPDEMQLDSGARLGPVTVAYETYGQLNADRTNAVLICHALSGDAHVAGRHSVNDAKPGWWDAMVGPGKGIDTDKYFVICSNILGGCKGTTGPMSVDPRTGKTYGLRFPVITVRDMVRVQNALIEHLGVETLLCVVGGSLGGMQALEWAVTYPDKMRLTILIACTHYTNAQQIAFDAVGRNAIQADPGFMRGDYDAATGPRKGLAIARMLAHITYLSEKSMASKFGRTLRDTEKPGYRFESEFTVETYLDYQGERFVDRFDANTYLYVTKAMDYFDVKSGFASLDESLARVNARTLLISFSSDWLFPPYLSEDIVYALARNGKEVSYCCVHSDYGHDAFLLEVEEIGALISSSLMHSLSPERTCLSHPSIECENRSATGGKTAGALPRANTRIDYDLIVDMIPPSTRVLDIGCGEGELLCRLLSRKNIRGLGMEVDENKVVACLQCGIPCIHANIDKGLSALPDKSFDYVILSMTLQVIKRPDSVLRELLRISNKCLVSFPNFAHWKVRSSLFFTGHAPVTSQLPYAWHESPNRHVLTIKDFREFCRMLQIEIETEIPLGADGRISFWPNLRADEALYVLSAQA